MTAESERYRYCPRDATPLVANEAGRPACPACGFVQYLDPKLAAGVIVARDRRVLLVRRNHEPGYGLWSFPSGFVDRGEVVEEAAAREAFEETGLRVRIERLLGVYGDRGQPVVLVMYAATIEDAGEPAPGPEALAVGFFALDALPELAFAHDRGIIEHRYRVEAG